MVPIKGCHTTCVTDFWRDRMKSSKPPGHIADRPNQQTPGSQFDIFAHAKRSVQPSCDKCFRQTARFAVCRRGNQVGFQEGLTLRLVSGLPGYPLKQLDRALEIELPAQIADATTELAGGLRTVFSPNCERLHGYIEIFRDREGSHVLLHRCGAFEADLQLALRMSRPEHAAVGYPNASQQGEPKQIRLVDTLAVHAIEDSGRTQMGAVAPARMFDQLIAEHDVHAGVSAYANVVFHEHWKKEIVVLDDTKIVCPSFVVF